MPPRKPSSWARRISADGAVEVAEDRRHDQPGPPLGARLAQLGRPPVVGTGAGEEVVGPASRDGVEPGAERGAHLAGDRVGSREHDLAGHPVAVELGVAPRCVPRPAQADLVEAVAFFVLRRTTPP